MNRVSLFTRQFIKDFEKSKYLLLLFLPVFVYMVIFRYLPMGGLIISLLDYNPFKGIAGSKFVGFENFKLFFSSHDFLKILRNTVLLGFYKLAWTFPAPLILALILNEVRNIHFKKLVQTISYVPHFLSVAVIASMTIMFLSPSTGLVNNLIKLFGGDPVYFMANPKYFRTIYIATDVWQEMGWGSIIYLAAITNIDPQLYESSYLDGANKFDQIVNITLPSISTTIVYLLIINAGNIVRIGFEKAYLLQNPGNYEVSEVISTYVYTTGLIRGNFSYATAAGFFNSIISFVFIYCANMLSKKISEKSLF